MYVRRFECGPYLRTCTYLARKKGAALKRRPVCQIDRAKAQAMSKRSAFITLAQAATKSLTNFSFASELA
jgi:hypothetical protein